ncbi:MAG: class I SAM-dependent methyltransferase [Solirubrobacterales bacterium]
MSAVLSSRDDWGEDEFFSTGAREIDQMMTYVESLDRPSGRDLALDFGCGLGRVTRPLARHFKRVVGVDIAAPMIAGARSLNGSCGNCDFLLNTGPDLRRFESGSFDFVYSSITLQHMRPELVKRYLAEFLRVTSDSGLILVQIPAGPRGGTAARVRHRTRSLRRAPVRQATLVIRWLRRRAMEMHTIPKQEVLRFLDSAGGHAIDVQPNQKAGPFFESYWYAVVRGGR